MYPLTVIERALELARAGRCHNIAELELRLKQEGYEAVYEHLSGSSFRIQLKNVIKEARRTR